MAIPLYLIENNLTIAKKALQYLLVFLRILF